MQFSDRLETARRRLAQVVEELEAIAQGFELTITPNLAGLYAEWLRDLADVVESLSR